MRRRHSQPGMARRATEASTEARTRWVTYFYQFPQVRDGEAIVRHRLLAWKGLVHQTVSSVPRMAMS